MARHVKNELYWKQKPKETATLRTKLFGIVRKLNGKRNQLKSTTFVTAEATKDFEIRAGQEQAKAIYFIHRKSSYLM